MHWPHAPLQLAQVVELRRTRVRLFYRCKSGTPRQPLVAAVKLATLQAAEPPLPLHNPMGRARMDRKQKVFTR